MKDEQEQIRKKCLDDGMIKIHFTLDNKKEGPAGETVWAYQLGETSARIANIPVFVPDISLDDVVEFEPSDNYIKEFVDLIEKKTYKIFIRYQTGENEEATKQNFQELYDFVKSNSWHIEATVPGLAMVAVGLDTNTMIFEREFLDAPHVLEFHEEYDEEEEI